GVERAGVAGDSLRRIVDGALNVRKKIESIASTADQQSQAAQAISTSIAEFTGNARQFTDGTAEVAEAGERLSGKAEQLLGLVGKFKLHASERRLYDQGPPQGEYERRSSALE
ncbi:MAG: hypothetical protein KDA28_02065, partial [Phycisphaerales bacterium]|nr:hypothetical protein [Phycisphaerales bacterium]